jgi:hypothetical protein
LRLAVVALAAGALGLALVWPASGAPSRRPASTADAQPAEAPASLPPIKHVFIIVLENESEATTFGPGSPAPYLAQTLVGQGAFLPNYYGIGHSSLDNYIAMIGGQPPNPNTQADCGGTNAWIDVSPTTTGADGVADGSGCVYPASIPTIASQLDTASLTWKGYMDSMGSTNREQATCAHPAVGGTDPSTGESGVDQYATKHDPFVYYHSIIDNQSYCDSHVVNLTALPGDLASAATTPNYSFITPGLCNDGHDTNCQGGPGGLAQVNTFLQNTVPTILNSPAYQQDGLLLITFDEASSTDATACCGEIAGPAAAQPGGSGPGGGDVGTVVLSPFITPGTVTQTAYNHYSMLGSVEDLFGLPHLGYAQLAGETDFGSDIFTNYAPPTSSTTSTTSTTSTSTTSSPTTTTSTTTTASTTTTTSTTSTTPAPPPVAHIASPALLSAATTTASVPLSWSGSSSAGRTISSFSVQAQDLSLKHPAWHTILNATTKRSAHVSEPPGHTLIFRVRATDSAGTVGAFSPITNTVVPSGIRPSKGRYDRDWSAVTARGAWLGRAIESSTPGATFTLTYAGATLNLIGETGPHGGTATVSLDGHRHTLHLHSATTHRRLLLTTFATGLGRHRLTITVAHGLVALEGYGISARTG